MLDIWDERRALDRRMDALVRTFFGPRSWIVFPTLPVGLGRPFIPATEVFTRNGDLVVRTELPGIDPDKDVHVSLVAGQLVIRGERKRTEEIKEEDYFRAETSYGTFERRVPIPKKITDQDIHASYDKGVLEVVIRGAAAAELPPEARRIPVQTDKPKIEEATKPS